MGTHSNDPAKYWRTSVAIPVARKPELERRLAALGLSTVGDLANLFMLSDGIVEILKPLMPAFREKQVRATRVQAEQRRQLTEQLKDMSPEELQRLMALASEAKKAA